MAIVKCADPNKVRNFFKDFGPGILAVIATLRSRFAYAACLGTSIGQMTFETIHLGMQDRLDKLSVEDRRWTEVGLQQSCRLLSFCLSFYASRVMNAFNAALQGSTALSKVWLQYIKSQQSLPEGDRSTVAKCIIPLIGQSSLKLGTEQEVLKWSIAMIGLYYQLRRDFRFPLAVKVPLAPLYLVEFCFERMARASSF